MLQKVKGIRLFIPWTARAVDDSPSYNPRNRGRAHQLAFRTMLHFLIGLVLVGFLIMLMAASPAFRNFVFIVLAAIGIGIWALLSAEENRSKEREAQRATEARQRATAQQAALAAFNSGQIKIDAPTLKPASYGLGDFIFEGTATNDAPFAMTGFNVEVTMTDCRASTCRIVGQKSGRVSVGVPAGQARAFSSNAIRLENLPPVGDARRSWNYKIIDIN